MSRLRFFAKRPVVAPPPPPPPDNFPDVYPGAGWTGVAGSGYVFGAPSVSAKNTASDQRKLAANRISMHRVRFSTDYAFGICAPFASSVIFHCEGNEFTCAAETARSLPHGNPNRSTRNSPAWWFNLKPSLFDKNGHIKCFVTINPADSTLKPRIIGPYYFYRHATDAHDYTVNFGTGLPTVANVSYPTFTEAKNAARLAGALAPHLICTVTDTYDLTPSSTTDYAPAYRCKVSAASGVTCTLGIPAFSSSLNPRLDGLWLYGELGGAGQVVLDFANIQIMARSGTVTSAYGDVVTNACSHGALETNSNGPYPLYQGLANGRNGNTGTGITERFAARRLNMNTGMGGTATFSTNVWQSHCASDQTGPHGPGTYQSDIEFGQQRGYRELMPTISAAYSGPGTATFAYATSTKLFTFTTNGSVVQISGNTLNNGVYYIDELISFLNGLGWTVSSVDETLTDHINHPKTARASQMLVGRSTSITKTITSTPTIISTGLDVHGDAMQQDQAGYENVLDYGMILWQAEVQNIFPTSSTGYDHLMINCAFHDDTSVEGYSSKIDNEKSNIRVVHCTMVNQSFFLNAALRPDAYSTIENNAFSNVSALTGAVIPTTRNNFSANGTTFPGSTGNASGGTMDTNYEDAANGDFRPKVGGSLAAATVAPAYKFDVFGNERSALDARGAVSINA